VIDEGIATIQITSG